MSIISFEFYLFVLISLLIYWIIPARFRWIILLFANGIYIYMGNGIKMSLLMLGTVFLVWISGILMNSFNDKPVVKNTILIITLLLETGCLISLKDLNFFINIYNFFGGVAEKLSLLAPLGISYYTMTLIGYTLDVYWGSYKAQRNILKFSLFAGYFPLLTSGPIVRYNETGEELLSSHRFSYRNICFGAQRILWGLFKKLVIANRIASFVDTVYGNYLNYQGLYVWMAMWCFVIQLYTDFSGCVDIVLGVSQMFGINLPENFNLPFSSRDISEFWRRWHITLGGWLRDYILYPILKSNTWQKIGKETKKKFGKKLGKKIPVWMGMFISWFLIGFWHGGQWNYIIGVGIGFWVIIVLGEILSPVFEKIIAILRINTECFSWKLFQCSRTAFIYMLSCGLFRSYNGLPEGIEIFKSAFSTFNPWILFNGSLLQMGLTKTDFNVLRISLLILFGVSILRMRLDCSIREWMEKQNLVFRWLAWIILFIIVLIYGEYGPGYNAAEFIYRGF